MKEREEKLLSLLAPLVLGRLDSLVLIRCNPRHPSLDEGKVTSCEMGAQLIAASGQAVISGYLSWRNPTETDDDDGPQAPRR